MQVPPTIAAYESGIKNLDATRSCLRASAKRIGINTTTTGVLLTKAESGATISISITRILISLEPANLPNHSPNASIVPVLSRAALSTNMHETIIGAGLENTANAFASGNIPTPTSNTNAPMATKSGENHSFTKAIKTTTRIIQTKI